MTRGDIFLSAIELLQNGRSVELVGARGSGRSHTVARIRSHFVRLGWQAVDARGDRSLQKMPFGSLVVSGLLDLAEGRNGALKAALRTLEEKLVTGRAVIVVDDADAMDESSWGVISSVSTRAGVPVLFVRDESASAAERIGIQTAPIASVFTVELPPMGFEELKTTLEGVIEATIEPTTMSRVYAKTGGNIGLAVALLESAKQTGRAHLSRGTLRADGSLWNPALQSIAHELLRHLAPAEVDVLRTLSLLGPAELGTAARLVDDQTLFDLEHRRFIRVVQAGERLVVTVDPPMLVEYFRHERSPGHRAETLRRIDESLAGGPAMEMASHSSDTDENPAVFVRLVHERLRRHTLHAREEWRQQRSLSAATQLLRALSADLEPTDDEVEALIADADALVGRGRERAQWEVARATYVAHHRHRPEEAAAALRAAADTIALPGEELRLRAEALVLEMETTALPPTQPFASVPLKGLEPHVREAVLLARLVWLTASGRVLEADVLAQMNHVPDAGDPRLDTVITVAALAMGRFTLAHQTSRRKLDEAKADFDATRLRVYAFLTAISAVLLRDFDEAEKAMEAPASVGSPASDAPLSFLGLMTLSGYFAANRGYHALASHFLDRLAEAGIPDGLFPGLQRGLIAARWAALESDVKAAEAISRELGDQLWERGARLAAAVAYLDGLRASPTESAWLHAEERIRGVDSPAIAWWGDFAAALVHRDASELISIVRAVAAAGEHAHAAQLAEIAMRVLSSSTTDISPDALTELEDLLLASPKQSKAVRVGLSTREREVAELIASGLSNPLIAEALVVSVRTVESHVNRLMRKLGAQDRNDIREYIRSDRAFG